MKELRRSRRCFDQAGTLIPGGVNSPVRAFGAVGGTPRFIARASGAMITDVDDNTYVDYVGAWGPMILGHAHPAVRAAIVRAADNGWSYGAPSPLEVDLAREICARVPSVEMVRMVNSGTEATMAAIRLARAVTGRDRVVKFAGCYHGHHDALLVAAGSGAATFGVPTSPGIPAHTAADTLVCAYNDAASVADAFAASPDDIACVIVEPVAGNMGTVVPRADFLASLREITRLHGALLILDEVMTGFRVARGGAQALFGVTPDITTLGKVIGGGLPVGAYGGRRDLMERISPCGDVYQAGTLSGNPLSMTAGLATLRELTDDAYVRLDALGSQLEAALRPTLDAFAGRVSMQRVGSMFTIFFGDAVNNFEDAARCNTQHYGRFFHSLLDSGVYFPPSQFEACFISLAHTPDDIAHTAAVITSALARAVVDA